MTDQIVDGNADLKRGEALFDLGRNEDALVHLRRSLLAGNDDARPLLTSVLIKLHRLDDAMIEADAMVALQPDQMIGHYWRARCLLELKDVDAAALAAGQALAIAPNSIHALDITRRVQVEQGNKQAALATVLTMLEVEPDESWVHVAAAEEYNSNWKRKRAEQHARRAVELDPEDVAALKTLSDIQFGRLRWYSSMKTAERVLSLDPTDDDAKHLASLLFEVWVFLALPPTLGLLIFGAIWESALSVAVGAVVAGAVATRIPPAMRRDTFETITIIAALVEGIPLALLTGALALVGAVGDGFPIGGSFGVFGICVASIPFFMWLAIGVMYRDIGWNLTLKRMEAHIAEHERTEKLRNDGE